MGQSTVKALARAHSMDSSVYSTRACTRVHKHAHYESGYCEAKQVIPCKLTAITSNSAVGSSYAILRKANFSTFDTQKTA